MIDEEAATRLLRDLCALAGVGEATREPLHVWDLSGVERLHLAGGATLVFKYASDPFTTEDQILATVAAASIPVPELIAARRHADILGMLMRDLGPTVREANDDDAAVAAVVVHRVPALPILSTVGAAELQAMPSLCLAHLARLRAACRWTDTEDLAEQLAALDKVASQRSQGAHTPPFGLCHGEFHHTSVHIGASGTRLVDFAKAFNGPGLLDLATWQGTRYPPDPARLRRLIHAYLAAGGHPASLADRGGLPAETWALAWHRIWAAHWYLDQAARDILHRDDDPRHASIVHRQLTTAAQLLTDKGTR